MLSAECSETDQEIKEQLFALFVWNEYTLLKAVLETLHSLYFELLSVNASVLGPVRNRELQMRLTLRWGETRYSSGWSAQVKLQRVLEQQQIRMHTWRALGATQATVTLNAQMLRRD